MYVVNAEVVAAMFAIAMYCLLQGIHVVRLSYREV